MTALKQYVDIGAGVTVRAAEVIGIFDLDNCTAGRRGKDFLPAAQRNGCLESDREAFPLSFTVTRSDETDRVILSPVSSAALRRRFED